MTGLPSSIVCAGCGWSPPPEEPYPFRCANAARDDDTDHVLTVVLDHARLLFPRGTESNPFLRFRTLLHSYHLARAGGLGDAEYVALVERLDRAVAQVDGGGFTVTPLGRQQALSDRLGFAAPGGIWVKDETGNVSGSHKGRHLMGLLIHLEVVERLRLVRGDGAAPDLAIASCGNAALAAAVVARAAERPLRVFIPTTADPVVVARLERLGALLTVAPRADGVPGDPTFHRLREAVRDGALPFTCQGNYNGLTIEGGKTLGYEMIGQMAEEGDRMDRLFIQVGGGALASAVTQAFADGVRLGALAALPRMHPVQTEGAFPLKRAYDRLIARAGASGSPQDTLRYAATHRSEFMWPWESEPRSVAGGILDDETYDWMAVAHGMLDAGGSPIVVSEETLIEANRLARELTGIPADPTGSAGLAGLIQLRRAGGLDAHERMAVLFTGVQR
ncbi:MAG: pyridoxal-phosphate dependent enzyme [bacterium]